MRGSLWLHTFVPALTRSERGASVPVTFTLRLTTGS